MSYVSEQAFWEAVFARATQPASGQPEQNQED